MDREIRDLVDSEISLIRADEQKPADVAFSGNTAIGIISHTKDRILEKAEEKINQEEIIEKHAESLSAVADRLMEVETEKASIEVQKKAADNRAEKQEIVNRLIVLRNEAKRLKKAEMCKNRTQKADISREKKQRQWERLRGTLEPLGYTYVPNFFALNILLMLTGFKAFFNGLNNVGTAVLKCFKWGLLIGVIIAILLIIPVTRFWILDLLGFLHK